MTWTKKYYDELWDRSWRRGARFEELSGKIKPRESFPDPRYLQIGEARSIIGAILFVDIVSFTERSEQASSKELLLTLDLFLAEMSQIIDDWGGTVEKFTGDGLMAVFDTAHTTLSGMVKDSIDAATTMRFAISGPINSYLENNGIEPIRYRIGIDGGSILVGKLGVRSASDPVTIGWAANIASKLQSISPVDGIYIGDFIYLSLPNWEQSFCIRQQPPEDWTYVKRGTSDTYSFYNYTAVWKVPT
jgi:adenylate cyclase